MQEEIKRGELVIYQLGKVAKDAKGKNDSRTLFGIRKNYNYTKEYDGIITNPNYKGPGFNDNDKALVSVLSNDKSANGIGKATVLKAIEEGVTVLDCYAVKTDKYRNGFLPQFYKQFGFQVAGTVPFNKEFAPKGKEWDDLVKVWKDRGWDGNVDNGPYPDIIIMKYIGGENSTGFIDCDFKGCDFSNFDITCTQFINCKFDYGVFDYSFTSYEGMINCIFG